MSKYNEFFETLIGSTKWDVPVSIKRNNPRPLDFSSVHHSYEDLKTYAETDATAYVGQICTVISDAEVAAYQITAINTVADGKSATIVKLAASVVDEEGGDLASVVAELQTKVANLQSSVEANTTAIETLNGADTVEGSVAKSIKDAVDGKFDAFGSAQAVEDKLTAYQTSNDTAVKANTDAITTLNGEGEGSVKQTVDDAIKVVVGEGKLDEAYDTLKEVSDWISAHGTAASEMLSAISNLETGLSNETKARTDADTALGDRITTAQTTADDAKTAAADEKTRAEAAEKVLSDAIDEIKADYLTSGDKTTLESAINDAKKVGEAAQETANTAITNAATAQTTANDAKTAAADEKTRAEEVEKELKDKITAEETARATADEALSTAIDNKIKLRNGDAAELSVIDTLNIAKISQEEYFNILTSTAGVDANTLYIISSNYIHAYDQPVKHVKDGVDATDAATINQLSTVSADLNAAIGKINVTFAAIDGDPEDNTKLKDVLDAKANTATTLTGYGITDAYTKTEVDGLTSALDTAITTEVNRAKGVEEALDGRVAAIEGDYLKAADKTELTNAIATAKSEAIDATTITITSSDVDGLAKRYTISQGGKDLTTTIDIPKDKVILSGQVVGEEGNQKLELTIANGQNVSIDLPDYIDIYNGSIGTTVSVDVTGGVISAGIKAGSLSAEHFAPGAITYNMVQAALSSAPTEDPLIFDAGGAGVTDAE